MKLKLYIPPLVVSVFLLSLCNSAFAQLQSKTIQEIQLLLQEKNARTPSQKKIDSRLLQFAREKSGQKMVAGVNLEPVKLEADNLGNVRVDITADATDKLLSKIEALGGRIIASSFKFHLVTAEINYSLIEKVASLSEIRFIEPAAVPILEGKTKKAPEKTVAKNNFSAAPKTGDVLKATFNERAARVKKLIQNYLEKRNTSAAAMFAGPITSQGDRTHRADDARNTYGYAGQGIRIGVLSDSYNSLGTASTDVANGELPGPGNPLGNTTPVTVVQDITGGTDEGRAMMQIVHDLAPKAQLFFATANISVAGFASNILALRSAPYNCDVIIDDVGYNNEPVFYDGPIAQAVNTVTASGAMYFSSAANSGSLAKGTSGVFEGDFNDAGSPIFSGSTKLGTVHNFGTVSVPSTGDTITAVGGFYSLHWADAPGASNNDYDLFLVSTAGTVKASSTTVQSGTQNPLELISAPALAAGDRLVVFKTTAAAPRAFHLNSNRGRLKFGTTGQTHGHACAINAYGVAATPALSPFSASTPSGPFPGAFTTANQVETFSSDGPRRIFFNADSTPVTPGNFLFGTNGGVVRNKPDITAANGVSTTLPGSSGLNPFYGTSAAAPHAGAIAALLKSAKPTLTPAQIRTILTTTTVDIETPGYDISSGYGILQAFQAMQAVSPTPLATVLLGTVTATEGSFKNNNGSLDPGEIGNLSIQLSNPSLMNATNVVATLTSNTPGVTVIQGTTNYGNINAGSNGVNTTPFTIALNSSVSCGSVINFVLSVSFEGGASPVGFQFSITIGAQPYAGGISAILGGTPPTGTGYTVVSGQQTGRLVRGTSASTCAVPIPNPGLTVTTGARQFDAYTFTNTNSSNQCVTVTLTSSNGLNIYSAAYNDSGFVPANPALHYIAEPGQSAVTQTYSFNVAAGKAFTVVVHDVNVTPASNSNYTLSLSLANCGAGPACTPVNITTSSISSGTKGTPYSQTFTATGGSGNYIFSIPPASLPAGLSISGNTLSGTPTQAGTFPITVTAIDPAGCPGSTQNYTLVIAGIAPASVTVTGSSSLSTHVCTTFPSLQATVRDASNNPLSGVNVIFTAPASAATGTFIGGATSVTVVTNASGVAVAPGFIANSTTGSYVVTASVVGVTTSASFNLTNTAFIVSSNADSGPGTLREAIDSSCAGGVITFSPTITQINLTSGELAINKALTITGTGASSLVISGSNLSRVFNITAGASSSVTISGVTIKNGKPQASSLLGGGGVLINTGIVTLSNCIISNNDVSLAQTSDGGGIYYGSTGTCTIDRCTILNNYSTRLGGGIANWGTSMIVTNSTITGNKTSGSIGYGGGVFSNVPATITNCTLYADTATFGGNIFRNGSTITLKNTIVAGGTVVGGSGPDLYGSTGYTSADYNLIQSTSGATITGTTTHNITGVSPLLLPLNNYGGQTPTLLLQSNSPAVNAGDPTLTSGTDQRGLARLVGAVADIGAVEVNYLVTSTGGTPQSTVILTPFASALQARVTEYTTNIAGVPVFYTAPTTGASGIFPNGTNMDTATTNSSGIATSKTFVANNTAGTYNVVASINPAFPTINYALTNTTVLPLTFSSISASAFNCIVQIEWKTATEINTKEFTVEHSTDGVSFSPLATIPAKGNSTITQVYNYKHTSTVEGINYYRIKQTDKNGAFTYTNVIIVSNSCGKQPIVAYPNPVKNKLTVILPGFGKYTLTIFDAVGRRIAQQVVSGGTTEINAIKWVKGIYNLSVSEEGQNKYLLKIIKD